VSRTDPYPGNRFSVEIEGLVTAGFAEVEGLGVRAGVFADPDDVPDDPPTDDQGRARPGGLFGQLREAAARAAAEASEAVERATWIDPERWPDIVTWTEPGSSNPPPRQRRAEFPRLTLRRGVTDADELERWIADWIAGASDERAVRIYLLDASGREVRGWECLGAIPVAWSGPTLRADRSAVAMESVELVHAGIAPIDT
jgi:phage tail-like protein